MRYNLCMNTSAKALSPTSEKPASPPVYVYHGLDNVGRIRLSRQDQELRVVGAVYATSTPPPGVKTVKVALLQVNASPGYQRDPIKDKKYRVHATTGETFRVVGQAETVAPSIERIESTRIIAAAAAGPEVALHPERKTDTTLQLVQPALSVALPPAATPRKKSAPTEAEIRRVAEQRADGLDPSVRMAYAAYYVGESPANLYKKIEKNQFPPTTKRSGGSFWLLSLLNAYKEGRWKPALAQP